MDYNAYFLVYGFIYLFAFVLLLIFVGVIIRAYQIGKIIQNKFDRVVKLEREQKQNKRRQTK